MSESDMLNGFGEVLGKAGTGESGGSGGFRVVGSGAAGDVMRWVRCWGVGGSSGWVMRVPQEGFPAIALAEVIPPKIIR
ncbi:hypothetical protein BJ970_006374 [Saccharopolyspora phatthalungensis]|uniref:Uncharacterized protein n=1 Tax=Saccharopolyspora phatthalungensis TaxID=664693 RepID=A0A840QJ48_9PSEU|nr:hypothetical protein [Saccharopolyspora phatthalungensis]